MKKIFLGLILLTLILGIRGVSSALEMNELPTFTTTSAYNNYAWDTPPLISAVAISPLPPAEGVPVTVSASIFNDPDKTDVETVSATLRYSLDGGKSWEEVMMEQDEGNERLWRGVIPGQPGGTRVLFYLSASDATGNITTEVPGENLDWPPLSNERLAQTVVDENDKEQIVPDSLDILSCFAGFDEEYLYFKMVIEKKITRGTLHPPFLHAYCIGLLNLDKGLNILGSYLLCYVPYLTLGNYPECVFYDLGHMNFLFDVEASAKVEENILYLRVKRSALGDNPSKSLRLFQGTLGITTILVGERSRATQEALDLIGFSEEMLKTFREKGQVTFEDINKLKGYYTFEDATNYTNLYLRNHSYTVGSGE